MATEKKLTIELTDEERETLAGAAYILGQLGDILYEAGCCKMTIEKEANIDSAELDTARHVVYTLSDFLIKWTAD